MRIIAGENRGRRLQSVKRAATRPTMDRVRETLFAILSPHLPGARFLDLFAGAGSVGLEALSRGVGTVAFVDWSRECAGAIRDNIRMLGSQTPSSVICRPWAAALAQLGRQGKPFDIVFADPPYPEEAILPEVAARVVEERLLAPEGWLILQHSTRLQLPPRLQGDLQLFRDRRFGDTMLSFYHQLPAAPADD